MDATDTPILGDDDLLKQIEQKIEEPIVAAAAVDEKAMVGNDEFHEEDDFEFGDFTEAGSSGEDDTEYVSHDRMDNSEADSGVLADELRAYQSLLERPGGREAFVDKVQGTNEVYLSVDTSKLCTLDSLEREDAYGSLLRLRQAPVSSRQGYSVESVFRQRLVNKLHLNSNTVIRSNTSSAPSPSPHTNSAAEEEEAEQEQDNHDTSQHAAV